MSEHREVRDVASVSGALFAARRTVWDVLDGFDPLYFLYHEDVDLSLRCRLRGLRVTYCPEASARHTYAFDKNPQKMYLLERNRLVTVLTDYPAGLLVRVLPALLVTEPLLLLLAAQQGWAGSKLRSWAWVATHASLLLARRRRVRTSGAHWPDVARTFEPRINQDLTAQPPAMKALNVLLGAYWRLVIRPQRSIVSA